MEFKTDIREVIEGSESENTTESVSKAKKLSRRTADITKKKKKKGEISYSSSKKGTERKKNRLFQGKA
jgi:hypothetical protein